MLEYWEIRWEWEGVDDFDVILFEIGDLVWEIGGYVFVRICVKDFKVGFL